MWEDDDAEVIPFVMKLSYDQALKKQRTRFRGGVGTLLQKPHFCGHVC
jgi:hypothetical protein